MARICVYAHFLVCFWPALSSHYLRKNTKNYTEWCMDSVQLAYNTYKCTSIILTHRQRKRRTTSQNNLALLSARHTQWTHYLCFLRLTLATVLSIWLSQSSDPRRSRQWTRKWNESNFMSSAMGFRVVFLEFQSTRTHSHKRPKKVFTIVCCWWALVHMCVSMRTFRFFVFERHGSQICSVQFTVYCCYYFRPFFAFRFLWMIDAHTLLRNEYRLLLLLLFLMCVSVSVLNWPISVNETDSHVFACVCVQRTCNSRQTRERTFFAPIVTTHIHTHTLTHTTPNSRKARTQYQVHCFVCAYEHFHTVVSFRLFPSLLPFDKNRLMYKTLKQKHSFS